MPPKPKNIKKKSVTSKRPAKKTPKAPTGKSKVDTNKSKAAPRKSQDASKRKPSKANRISVCENCLRDVNQIPSPMGNGVTNDMEYDSSRSEVIVASSEKVKSGSKTRFSLPGVLNSPKKGSDTMIAAKNVPSDPKKSPSVEDSIPQKNDTISNKKGKKATTSIISGSESSLESDSHYSEQKVLANNIPPDLPNSPTVEDSIAQKNDMISSKKGKKITTSITSGSESSLDSDSQDSEKKVSKKKSIYDLLCFTKSKEKSDDEVSSEANVELKSEESVDVVKPTHSVKEAGTATVPLTETEKVKKTSLVAVYHSKKIDKDALAKDEVLPTTKSPKMVLQAKVIWTGLDDPHPLPIPGKILGITEAEAVDIIPIPAVKFQPEIEPEICTDSKLPLTEYKLGPTAVFIICPECEKEVTTKVISKAGHKTWKWFSLFTICCLWGINCLPFIIKCFKDQEHYCPECKTLLGRYKRY